MYLAGDVTILIPVYITEERQLEWFRDCLISAKSQGCDISIIDDASTIPINRIIVDGWQEGMHFSRNPVNEGVSSSRNTAVRRAETPLIFPLDADDTLKRGAIQELVGQYNGTPVYTDLSMFGDKDIAHYQLLDFNCDLLYEKVGLSSVNVLHEVKQWKRIGGWKEDILFYEDGEYNARLMLNYCGRRYPKPLVNYRQHDLQRTHIYKPVSAQQVRKMLHLIREYKNMAGGCCGKGRRKSAIGATLANIKKGASNVNVAELPGTQEGRVLVQYVGGKGGGKHYYRGLVTKFPYNVKYGQYYYVDPADAKEEYDKINHSLFVIIPQEQEQPKPEKKEVVKVEESKAEELERKPRKSPEKAPIMYKPEEESEELPDIANLRWRQEIRHMEFSPEQAKQLHSIESKGKKRVKVLAHLKKYMK